MATHSLNDKKDSDILVLEEIPYEVELIEEGKQDGAYYSDSSSDSSSNLSTNGKQVSFSEVRPRSSSNGRLNSLRNNRPVSLYPISSVYTRSVMTEPATNIFSNRPVSSSHFGSMYFSPTNRNEHSNSIYSSPVRARAATAYANSQNEQATTVTNNRPVSSSVYDNIYTSRANRNDNSTSIYANPLKGRPANIFIPPMNEQAKNAAYSRPVSTSLLGGIYASQTYRNDRFSNIYSSPVRDRSGTGTYPSPAIRDRASSVYTPTSAYTSNGFYNRPVSDYATSIYGRPVSGSIFSASMYNRPMSGRASRASTIYSSPVSDSVFESFRSRPVSGLSSIWSEDLPRRPRPVSLQLPHPVSRNYPIFTIAITIAIWLSYILGIVLSNDITLNSISWHTPVSPPNWQWWFYTVGPFPSCTDERFQGWRLFSMQLVHAGLWHIGGNSISILIFGSTLEIYHPLSFLSTIIIFEASVASGVLGYSFLSPYDGLVGASPGCYGLIGACWYVAIFHRDLIDPMVAFVLPIVLIAQMAMDLVFFYLSFNSTTAYSSHVIGLLSGFFLSMALTMTYRKISWTAILLSFIGSVIFSVMVGYFLWHYLIFYPPEPVVASYWYNTYIPQRCCARLFALMEKYPAYSKDYLARTMGYCSDT